MYTTKNTIKISDLRKHTAEVVEEIETLGIPVTVFAHSKPRVVIMAYESFEALREKSSHTQGPITENIDIFGDPPDHLLIKTPGLDAVKEIRKLRGYNQ